MKDIHIKSKKKHAISRKHPWVFSGAIHRIDPDVKDGDTIRMVSGDDILGYGHYQNGSIAIRVLSFDHDLSPTFWSDRIKQAYIMRKNLNIVNHKTNAYRLIHGEGDGLPGVIVDIYNKAAIIQCHSAGMYKDRKNIADAITYTIADIDTIYIQVQDSIIKYIPDATNHYLMGDKSHDIISEHGVKFEVNWEEGQKTGFFLDQRDNRFFVREHSKDKSVLNCFSYSGGFSMYALDGDAASVTSVDISQVATDLATANEKINNFDAKHEVITANVLTYLADETHNYDIVIIDPPAFAKSLKKRHNAVQAYKRLNASAIKRVKPNGLLYTFSCSQVVDKELFENTVRAAAIEAGRTVQIVRYLSQGSDHPVNIFHPEGHYLKGLMLYVK